MDFKKPEQFPILVCGDAGSTFSSKQNNCHGMQAARAVGDHVLYIDVPFTRYHIALRKARHTLKKIQLIAAVLFFLIPFAVVLYYILLLPNTYISVAYWKSPTATILLPLSIAFLGLLYLWYRLLVQKTVQPEIEPFSSSEQDRPLMLHQWEDITHVPHKKRVSIFNYFTEESQAVIEQAYMLAAKQKAPEITPVHLFHALLSEVQIGNIFVRLGIGTARLKTLFENLTPTKTSPADPLIGNDVWQILFAAYDEAVVSKQPYVDLTELLLATVRQSTVLQEFLYDYDVEADTLANVVEWIRIREHLRHQYKKMRQVGATRNKYGLDRAMTAVATPYLNAFSQDLTMAANYGRLEHCVAREKEIDEIFRVVEGGRQSVLLVGDRGVGKMSIIYGIAQRMVAEDVPDRLKDKRLVQLSTSALVAGTTLSGAQERLLRMMREIRRAGNIMLVIENLQDLVSVGGDGEGLDVSETLAEELNKNAFLTFATTTTEGFNKHIINTQIGQVFSRIDVKEMDQNQAIRVLESKAGLIEYKQQVYFSYKAIAKAVEYAGRFIYDQQLPSSALGIITEAASYCKNTNGAKTLVMPEDVAVIISQKTGIPTTSISSDESEKLLKLEEAMHERLVGQDEAVVLVASALRRARADIRSGKRPIANFLFLGPTGVGKTELAKTIAEIYFGGEERMIRIDMSEYQDQSAIYRMIGQPGKQGTGILTEAVRQQPFSLVLLDEMEKADPNVLNLFLQVFDDGRLTDSVGRVIDFTNTIIIATSNAGTEYVQSQLQAGIELEQIRDSLIRTELKQYYRPEFLNRFDGIVLFRSLQREEIKEIAKRMLQRLGSRLEEERGVQIRIDAAALESLADVGFDPEFGARPMRRAIQDRVENGLAEFILSGRLNRRDTIVIGEGLELRVE